MEIAKKHKIKVIEDCAQSYNCYYKGRLTGTIGDIGCFSLNDFKHISAGYGGMCIMNDDEYFYKAYKFADKNYTRITRDGHPSREIEFLAPNYRMSELQGAVGLAQLDRLNWICEPRNTIGEGISKGIADLPGIHIPKIIEGGKSSYWFYMFRLDEKAAKVSRDEFCKALNAEGILCEAGYIPKCVYEYDLFKNLNAYDGTKCPFNCRYYGKDIKYYTGMCPEAESILNTAIRMGVNEFYTEQDMNDIINGVRKVSRYYSER